MPTRSNTMNAELKESAELQNISTEDACDAAVAQATSLPCAKKARFIRTDDNELDRVMRHTTEELKLNELHCTFPALNVGQAPLHSPDELRVYPSCELSMPGAVYVANKHCERVDICHRRNIARALYRKRLHIARTRYHTVQKDKNFKSDEKKGVYHVSLFDLARRLESDPDPFFHGSYDYYYSGGNLSVLPDNGLVLHVDDNGLNNLNVGTFSENLNSLNSSCSLEFEPFDEIFEVRPLRNFHNKLSNCFAVRQRNSVTLRQLKPNGKIRGLMQFKTKYTPFISFAQSTHNINTFVVTTMKQSVRVYDLNRASNSLQEIHEVCPNAADTRISWNMVKPWREQTFLYANEQEFFLMDLRTSPAEWLKSSCGRADTNFECDLISSIAKSEFLNLAYVATSHKLHCLDLRYLGNYFDKGAGALCCWTHQLEYAPAFFDTFRSAGAEYLALSSALADDLHICELTREHRMKEVAMDATKARADDVPGQLKRCVYKSVCLPYKPPTLEEAYQNARVAGKCLQPDADLKTRIQRCTTGLAFYDTTLTDAAGGMSADTFALLLTANSIGDVYARAITERKSQEPEERDNSSGGDETMHNYAEKVCAFKQPELNCTSVVDLKAMRKVLRCESLSAASTIQHDDKAKLDYTMPKRHGLGRWQKSVQALHSYKDALVQDLLAIWDIDYDEQNNLSLSHIKTKLDVKEESESLVSSWLTKNMLEQPQLLHQQPQANNVMTVVHDLNMSIKLETSIHIDDTEDRSMFAEEFAADLCTQQQSTQLHIEETLQETVLLKPLKKKKPKYVKGF